MNYPAQSFEVSGTVFISTVPVRNASITFIDNSDTARQFTSLTNSFGEYCLSLLTSVKQQNYPPKDFDLEQNYPNPFSGATVITYRLLAPSEVQLTIFDVLGREVKKIYLGAKAAGAHQLFWDGENDAGERVAAGVYFYQIKAENKRLVRKMMVVPQVNQFAVSISNNLFSQNSAVAKRTVASAQNEYTVRIENTESTFPVIVPKVINNVLVSEDAVINFTVEDYVSPDAALVFLDSTQQLIRGFGAANILPWRPDMTAAEIENAFGTGDGQIGLTILRLRLPSDTNGFSSNVPTARAAYSRGITIIASPWSPPASMKTNNNIVGGRLRESRYADYAAHLKSFADYMERNGVPLFAISIQNEPDVQVTYESCDWSAAEMLKFVRENAQDIGTKVMAPESFNFNHAMSDLILSDSTAASHVAIIGGHIYGGGLSSYPLAKSKSKELWMTEHLDTDTSWTKVLATGKEINDCMLAGMNAYIWWYIVRFYGPIKEDGKVSKRGYVMSQFARFVRPGYTRIYATQRPQSQVYVTAYRGDSKVVIVAINQRSQAVAQTFVLKDGDAVSFTPYVTSKTENAAQKDAISTLLAKFSATLPPSSVTTFVSP